MRGVGSDRVRCNPQFHLFIYFVWFFFCCCACRYAVCCSRALTGVRTAGVWRKQMHVTAQWRPERGDAAEKQFVRKTRSSIQPFTTVFCFFPPTITHTHAAALPVQQRALLMHKPNCVKGKWKKGINADRKRPVEEIYSTRLCNSNNSSFSSHRTIK